MRIHYHLNFAVNTNTLKTLLKSDVPENTMECLEFGCFESLSVVIPQEILRTFILVEES